MSDDDLPTIPIAVSYNSGDFSMPSADVLASQRAREEKCEQELQELGSQFNSVFSPETHLSQASDANSSDSEASLTAAVKALTYMEQQVLHSASPPSTMLYALISTSVLRSYDLDLFKQCLRLLDTNNEKLIENTLHKMVSDIRQCLRKANRSDALFQGEDIVVLCCWLCMISLWSGPQPGGLREVLMEVLTRAGPALSETVAAALSEALTKPCMLVKASDVVFGSSPAQRHLSELLLTAALDVLDAPENPTPIHVPLPSLSTICKRIKPAWRGLDPDKQLTALMLAGRVAARTEMDPANLEALQELLVHVMQASGQPLRQATEYLQILVEASKLQILFELNNVKATDSFVNCNINICIDDNVI